MEVVHITLDDAPAMIAEGSITDAKTVIGLTLAIQHLRAG
jgi:hypothetical protein